MFTLNNLCDFVGIPELICIVQYDYESGSDVTFSVPEKVGTYYVVATDPNVKDPVEAKLAPATARIVVTDTLPEEPLAGDINADGFVDLTDVTLVLQMINGTAVALTEEQKKLADISGDKVVDMMGVATLIRHNQNLM